MLIEFKDEVEPKVGAQKEVIKFLILPECTKKKFAWLGRYRLIYVYTRICDGTSGATIYKRWCLEDIHEVSGGYRRN